MRGRKPTPTVLRILRNNPGKRPVNTEEPKPNQLDLACPDELSDPVAQVEWKRTVVPAIELGLVTLSDRTAAIAHCELWATWRSQLEAAGKHAHVVAAGKHGYPMPNPARMMANKTLQLLMKVDAELGFTAVSRSRVKTEGPRKRNSKVDRFRDRKTG